VAATIASRFGKVLYSTGWLCSIRSAAAPIVVGAAFLRQQERRTR
jgi:hypothetical protein